VYVVGVSWKKPSGNAFISLVLGGDVMIAVRACGSDATDAFLFT
jgi:hypothetical protein